MRRVLLLAALAAPALAAAQAIPSGAIQFADGTNGDDLVHGPYISLAECQGSATAGPFVKLSWTTALNSGATFPGDAKYTVYASNKESTAPNCLKANDTASSVTAGPIGTTLTGLGQMVNLQPFATSQIAAVAGLSCTTSADTPVYVCVQAYLADGTSAIGYAKGKLTLSTVPPASPTGVGGTPADSGALIVSWTAPTGSPAAYDYRVWAVNANDPSSPHETIVTQATSTTISGLSNDVPYTLSVWARSLAGNENPAPGTGNATPQLVLNFWDVYRSSPGAVETGGCGMSAAGPVALLGLAALLAKLRRRA